MLNKILIAIIIIVILYDYYLTNIKKNTVISTIEKNTIKKIIDNPTPINGNLTNESNRISTAESIPIPVNEKLQSNDVNIHDYHDNDDSIEVEHKIDSNMFGPPTEVNDKYILWTFNDPNPWNKILYRAKTEYPFYFFINIKIPSLNDYENWKRIMPDLDFNAKSRELIIPADDEEAALAIANLIITNFIGDISMDDIVKKDLIAVSIIKARKYEIVKNKIREQINSNLKPKVIEKISNVEYQKDLAKEPEIVAWEGSEFSFI